MLLRALIALLAAAGTALAAQDGADGATRTPVEVVAIRSEARPYSETLILRGRTEADRHVVLRAEIAGLVASEPLQSGAVVSEGDALCRLAPGDREAALAEAQANLRQAEVENDAAIRLQSKGFAAETQALTRAALLEAARAQVMKAQLDMDRLTIAAPFDGVLDKDTAELGTLLQPGSECASLMALDPIVLVGFVSERDVDRLTPGDPATGRLVSGREVEATIRYISRAADSETRTYRVEAAAPNPDLSIRAGMTAEIRAPLRSAPAHLAPQSALTLDDGGRLGVRVVRDGAAYFAPVTIVADGPDGVWLAGLPPEADIIVVGQEYVGEGHPVTVSWRETTG
jgi:multidrug efflux system membrane fusion protein